MIEVTRPHEPGALSARDARAVLFAEDLDDVARLLDEAFRRRKRGAVVAHHRTARSTRADAR
jgi:hypothetical protein